MKSILNLFKPAPFIDEIQNPEVVKEQYRYWRIRILYSMFIGYAFFYFTRKSYSIAMPGLIENLHFDKAQLGILGSVFSITYAISKFTSGVMSDRSNPRYFMALGLMMTGVVNLCFGLSSSIVIFAIFWGMNGWFQGFGAPPCVRFLTCWYSHSERGSWWSTWSISHNVGAFLIPYIAGPALGYFGWRYAMFVPGVLCIFGGLFLVNRLRDTPGSLGLPPIEKFRNDYAGSMQSKTADGKDMTGWQIFMEYILKNKYIWVLAVAYFFVYVVRAGLTDWTNVYLWEAKGYNKVHAPMFASLFEVGGLCGSLCAGWFSDRIFGAKRGPVNALYALGILVSITLFWYVPAGFRWLDSMALFFMGFTIFGPQMLIGVAAAELTHKQAVATSNGFIGCSAYLGAAVAGYPLGKITQEWGWDGFFVALLCCGLITVLLLMPMWNVT